MKSIWRIGQCLMISLVVAFTGVQVTQAQVNQDVDVTGTVLPNETSFQLAIIPSTSNVLSQDTNITFTITYGSHLGYSDQMIIQAEWDWATIDGAAAPTIDLVQFNDGSATNAYAQTPAVVDKINHTIVWTIGSFPASTTDQTVSFSMNTNFSYMSSGRLTFPVRARLVNPSYTTNDRTVITSYEYDRNRSTPYSYTGPSPTPTPVVQLAISRLMVKNVSDTVIELYLITNKNADLTVKYGTSLGKMSQILTLSPPTWTTTISLQGLNPGTTYYVQIFAQSGSQTAATNILKLTTAGGPTTSPTQVDKSSLVFISSDIATFNPVSFEGPVAIPSLVLPKDITYIFAFRVNNPKTIKRVQAILYDNRILGVSTQLNQTENLNIYALDLPQIAQGFYQGRLKTPSIPGEYRLAAQIYNADGNISTEALADISVSEPLSVYNKYTNDPVEKAQINLDRFDYQTETFVRLSEQVYAVRNPDYTDNKGQITFFLPVGIYQIEIDALGYKREIKTFEIGTENNKHYPKFYLTPESLSLASFIYYYWNIAVDFTSTATGYVQSLAYSNRYFELNAFLVTSLLVLFAFVAFGVRIHIPLLSMFDYFFHIGQVHLSGQKEGMRVVGKIVDKQTGNNLAGCEVCLLNWDRQTVVGQMHSGDDGGFSFLKLSQIKYALQISKPGYNMIILEDAKLRSGEKRGLVVEMEKIKQALSVRKQLTLFFRQVLEMLFELLLVLSLVLEVAMVLVWGWEKTFIFLIISMVNLVLWVVHLMHQNVQTK